MLAVLVTPSRARAEAPGVVEPIVLTYDATGPCPSEAEFYGMVRAYTARWTSVPEGTVTSRTIRVRASSSARETVGRLTVANATGTITEREIAGPSCEAVSQALAIMVAVAIDPHRDATTEHADPTAPATSDAGAPVEPPSSRAPGAPAHAPHEPPAPGRSTTAGKRREALRWSLDLRAELTSAVVSGPLPLIAASVELEPSFATRPGWPRWWRPSVGIGVRQSFSKQQSLRGGTVSFLWTAGGARVCPFRFSVLGDVVELSTCAEMNVGVLQARAEGFAESRRASILWFDLGGSAWVRMQLTPHVFLSGTVLVTAPFSRRRFELASGVIVSSPPPVGLLGGVGIGVNF